MTTKFKIYSQVRNARQAAGNIHEAVKATEGWSAAETIEWGRVEEKLNEVECMLEKMDLTKEVPHVQD